VAGVTVSIIVDATTGSHVASALSQVACGILQSHVTLCRLELL
jgi:hypothetical protein